VAVLSRHVRGSIDEKHKNVSRQPVSREGFEPRTTEHNVRSEVLTAVVMKSSIF
jgi:hypothetical protein